MQVKKEHTPLNMIPVADGAVRRLFRHGCGVANTEAEDARKMNGTMEMRVERASSVMEGRHKNSEWAQPPITK